MSETTNSPQLILLYTLCAALVFLPRLNTHLNTPVTASLVSHLLIAVGFFGTLTCLVIDSLYIISKLLLILLKWALQTSSDTRLSDYLGAQWRLAGSEGGRFWVKMAISVIAGIWLTCKLFFNSTRAGGKGWEAAKRNIAAKREAHNVAMAEQGGTVAKDIDNGSAWLWATCALVYAVAVFDSKEWFMSVLRGGIKVERTREWDIVCLCSPTLIAGAIGLARWRWIVKARRVHLEKEDVGGEASVSEKQ